MVGYANSVLIGLAKREGKGRRSVCGRAGVISAVLCAGARLSTLWPQPVVASNGNAGLIPRKTIESATITPVLVLSLSVDKSQAIPSPRPVSMADSFPATLGKLAVRSSRT